MDENEVKKRTKEWLEKKGYTVKSEVGVPGTNREVIMDYYAYREREGEPEILWVECKGDCNLSYLLEGFVRLEFTLWLGGGIGILAIPHEAKQKLLKHEKFFEQAQNIITLLDIQEIGIPNRK